MSSDLAIIPPANSDHGGTGPDPSPSMREISKTLGGDEAFSSREKWQKLKRSGSDLEGDTSRSRSSAFATEGDSHEANLIEAKAEDSDLGQTKKGKAIKKKKERGAKKKKKANKQNSAHPKPKRPMSAYNFFFRDERLKILAEMGESNVINGGSSSGNVVTFEEMGKLIGHRWKNLEGGALSKYNALADTDSKRYKAELTKYYDEEDARRRASYFSHIAGASGTGLPTETPATKPELTTPGQTSQFATPSALTNPVSQANIFSNAPVGQQSSDPQMALSQLNQFLTNMLQQQAANEMAQQQLLKTLQQQQNQQHQPNHDSFQEQGQGNFANGMIQQASVQETSGPSSGTVGSSHTAAAQGVVNGAQMNPSNQMLHMSSISNPSVFQGQGAGLNGNSNLNNHSNGLNMAALLLQLQNNSQAQQLQCQGAQQQLMNSPFGQQGSEPSGMAASYAASGQSGRSSNSGPQGMAGLGSPQPAQNGGGQQQQFQNTSFPSNAFQLASIMSMMRKN